MTTNQQKAYVMHVANRVRQTTGTERRFALRYGWAALAIRKQLQLGVLEFHYYKKDGTLRHARGTLHPLLIPPQDRPTDSLRYTPDYRSVPYYDIERKDWRAFRIDCLTCSIDDKLYTLQESVF